jgi:hypothetical protein
MRKLKKFFKIEVFPLQLSQPAADQLANLETP